MAAAQEDTNTVCDVDQLSVQWRNMEMSITSFKSQAAALQQQFRLLEKATHKQMNLLKKDASKNKHKGNRKPSGFAKPSKISKELSLFMGKEDGIDVARTEVTQFIIAYIKENKLSESKDIKPDKKLQDLLGANTEDKITYFNIQKFMNKHFPKAQKKSQEMTTDV